MPWDERERGRKSGGWREQRFNHPGTPPEPEPELEDGGSDARTSRRCFARSRRRRTVFVTTGVELSSTLLLEAPEAWTLVSIPGARGRTQATLTLELVIPVRTLF